MQLSCGIKSIPTYLLKQPINTSLLLGLLTGVLRTSMLLHVQNKLAQQRGVCTW